ncbi:hypothetical protein BU16DRAFT_583305 [Lophium mytilinum]|uniref:Uncharacterized protein n=1 Tax=Lophium mytilinum TaxID=390894 RepID=A0A6A6QQM2_9PEZI|nr:hypothetical protein BU16DRAFT_583305 [Lophium mytilinum]
MSTGSFNFPSDKSKPDPPTKGSGTPKPERTTPANEPPAPSPQVGREATPHNDVKFAPNDAEAEAPNTPNDALQSVVDRAATPHPSKHKKSPPSAEKERMQKVVRRDSPSPEASVKAEAAGEDPFVDKKEDVEPQIMKVDLKALKVRLQPTIDQIYALKPELFSDGYAQLLGDVIRQHCPDLGLTQEESIDTGRALHWYIDRGSQNQPATTPAPVLPLQGGGVTETGRRIAASSRESLTPFVGGTRPATSPAPASPAPRSTPPSVLLGPVPVSGNPIFGAPTSTSQQPSDDNAATRLLKSFTEPRPSPASGRDRPRGSATAGRPVPVVRPSSRRSGTSTRTAAVSHRRMSEWGDAALLPPVRTGSRPGSEARTSSGITAGALGTPSASGSIKVENTEDEAASKSAGAEGTDVKCHPSNQSSVVIWANLSLAMPSNTPPKGKGKRPQLTEDQGKSPPTASGSGQAEGSPSRHTSQPRRRATIAEQQTNPSTPTGSAQSRGPQSARTSELKAILQEPIHYELRERLRNNKGMLVGYLVSLDFEVDSQEAVDFMRDLRIGSGIPPAEAEADARYDFRLLHPMWVTTIDRAFTRERLSATLTGHSTGVPLSHVDALPEARPARLTPSAPPTSSPARRGGRATWTGHGPGHRSLLRHGLGDPTGSIIAPPTHAERQPRLSPRLEPARRPARHQDAQRQIDTHIDNATEGETNEENREGEGFDILRFLNSAQAYLDSVEGRTQGSESGPLSAAPPALDSAGTTKERSRNSEEASFQRFLASVQPYLALKASADQAQEEGSRHHESEELEDIEDAY